MIEREAQATLSFQCRSGRQGRALLDQLARTPQIAMTLLRGRVTAEDARYTVALQGNSRTVDRVCARLRNIV